MEVHSVDNLNKNLIDMVQQSPNSAWDSTGIWQESDLAIWDEMGDADEPNSIHKSDKIIRRWGSALEQDDITYGIIAGALRRCCGLGLSSQNLLWYLFLNFWYCERFG